MVVYCIDFITIRVYQCKCSEMYGGYVGLAHHLSNVNPIYASSQSVTKVLDNSLSMTHVPLSELVQGT